jgi:ferritin
MKKLCDVKKKKSDQKAKKHYQYICKKCGLMSNEKKKLCKTKLLKTFTISTKGEQMISIEMQKALNKQLNKEFHSAYIYLSMSAYASKEGFNGCANWFNIQYQEEVTHAMKLFRYLEDQGADIELTDVKAFKVKAKNILEVFNIAFKHEQSMTNSLNMLSDTAMKEKDHATYNLLQWYVNEQVEEEATFGEIIDKFNMVGNDGYGLYSIDKELGSRVFVDPTTEA